MRTNRITSKMLSVSRRITAAVVLFLFLFHSTGCTHVGQAKPADVIRRPVPIIGVVTEGGSRYQFSAPGWIVRDTVFGPMKTQAQTGRQDSTYTFPVDNVHRLLVRQEGLSTEVMAIAGVLGLAFVIAALSAQGWEWK